MIVIGTRGSDLALTQAHWIAACLQARGVPSRLEIIRTQGDRVQHLSLDKLEGKGFFTKEIEDALLAKHVDLAVHSLKDLPTEDTPGLSVVAIPQREDVRDCLLTQKSAHAADGGVLTLVSGGRVGTSAVRRKALLLHLRPDLQPVDLRGNVPTRVNRLREQRYDAVVLAQAGLSRLQLDLQDFVVTLLPPHLFVPAPGQGALALQMRTDDPAKVALVLPLHDAAAAGCVDTERLLLKLVGGGCHTPLGAHATYVPQGVRLTAFLGDSQALGTGKTVTVEAAHGRAAAELAWQRLQAS